MTKFEEAKIYKIIDNTNDKVYIGSTCEPTLARCLAKHVSSYKDYKNGGKSNYITSFDIIKNNDYAILLVEAYPCKSKDQLLARERYWTNIIDCINKNKPGLLYELGRVEYNKQYNTYHQDQINEKNKQYYIEHQDQINEKQKQYRIEHKDKIKEWKATKCDCICGGKYVLANKSRHIKSKTHIKYIQTETLKKCMWDNLSFEQTRQIYNKL